jgi:hypothetical protein
VTFHDNGDGTATLSGTPAAGTGGSYVLTLTANNGVTPVTTQRFTLVVDQALAFTSAPSTTFQVGKAGGFAVRVAGFPVAAISDGGAKLPAGVTFKPAGAGVMSLSGTPAALSGGVYRFTITATNSAQAPVTQSFTLTVLEAPTFRTPAAATFVLGRHGSFTVVTAAFPGGSGIHISDGGAKLPAGVTFHDNGNGTATIAGTPSLTSGVTFPMTLTATNGVAPNGVQHFVLTVASAPGYILVSSAGSVYAFGGTRFAGSLPSIHVVTNQVVATAETLDGLGYWIVTSTGKVYAFGDAHNLGSVKGTLHSPIVGLQATPDARGYWLVARDGGIFAFGDAKFFGSTGAIHLNQPIVGLARR